MKYETFNILQMINNNYLKISKISTKTAFSFKNQSQKNPQSLNLYYNFLCFPLLLNKLILLIKC